MSNDRASILCFPSINLDKGDPWTMQALLYWDEICSIVPPDHQSGHLPLDPFMRELVQSGLVRCEWLGGEIYGSTQDNFSEAFFGLLDDAKSDPRDSLPSRAWPRVHHEKMEWLARELVARQLAVAEESPWYRVKPSVAALFMTMLAIQMGQVSGLIPATNDTECTALLASMAAATSPQEEVRVSSRMLRNILPVPGSGTSLQRIRDFKDKHHELLARFREDISTRSIHATAVHDGDVSFHSRNLAQQLNELESKMRESGFNSIQKTNWLDYGVSWADAGTSAALVQGTCPLGIVKALSSAGKLLRATLEIVRSSSSKKEISRHPLAYAALARSKFHEERDAVDRRRGSG